MAGECHPSGRCKKDGAGVASELLSSWCRKVEQRFHMCDRMAIYFFIAASYSPWWVTRQQAQFAQGPVMLRLVCVCVCVQADAEGAGTMVVPHALADMAHGLPRLRVRLLFPREVTPTRARPPPADRADFDMSTCPPGTVQVQTAGPAGLRGHGGAPCAGAAVHGKAQLLGQKCGRVPEPGLFPVTLAGGADGHGRAGVGRPLLCGGCPFLQERRPGPLRSRHLAPFRGGGSERSLLRHLEVPVLTGVDGAHVQVTKGPPPEMAFRGRGRKACSQRW